MCMCVRVCGAHMCACGYVGVWVVGYVSVGGRVCVFVCICVSVWRVDVDVDVHMGAMVFVVRTGNRQCSLQEVERHLQWMKLLICKSHVATICCKAHLTCE